jgi:hypothetical protein
MDKALSLRTEPQIYSRVSLRGESAVNIIEAIFLSKMSCYS